MPKNKTYQERLVAGLKSMGYIKDLDDKSRFEAFFLPEKESKLYVGRNGALRSGLCASQSHSIGQPGSESAAYKRILAAGDRVIAAGK